MARRDAVNSGLTFAAEPFQLALKLAGAPCLAGCFAAADRCVIQHEAQHRDGDEHRHADGLLREERHIAQMRDAPRVFADKVRRGDRLTVLCVVRVALCDELQRAVLRGLNADNAVRHNDAALFECDDVAGFKCLRLGGLDEDEIADLDMILRRAAHRAGLDSQRRYAEDRRRGIGRERAFNYNSKIADQQQGKDDAQHETDDLNCGYTAGFPAGIYVSVFSQGTTSEDGQNALENAAKMQSCFFAVVNNCEKLTAFAI